MKMYLLPIHPREWTSIVGGQEYPSGEYPAACSERARRRRILLRRYSRQDPARGAGERGGRGEGTTPKNTTRMSNTGTYTTVRRLSSRAYLHDTDERVSFKGTDEPLKSHGE